MATNQEIIKKQILEAYNNLSSKGSSSNIISADGFYFESGKQALNKLRNEENKTLLSDLYKYINNKRANKENWYDSLYGENTPTEEQIKYRNTCELINKFVAYCDINAKGTDVSGISYYGSEEEKRCIAKVNMAPPTWIMNILKYLLKESKETQYKDLQVTNKVQRAINYFDNPTEIFPIVSEEHRKQISKYFLEKEKLECDEELKKLFDDAYTDNKPIEENRTCFYTSIIYEMKDKWEDLDVSFYENNKNVILTGAPGTGKTYLAKKIAAKIIGCTTTDELKNHPQFGFVQFHPSYDYTDFVEGLRPVDNGNGQVGFVLKNGIFKDFCERAAEVWIGTTKTTNTSNNPKELQRYREENAPKYVFVIDEINRGEISKIFGELFFSIDPGYRGTDGAVLTQYSNMRNNQQQGSTIGPNIFDKILKGEPLNQPGQQESDQSKDAQQVIPNGHFFIPKNVYIIGTMNDIDRSVESMDFAFRRRFAFREITAAESKENILYYSDLGLDLDTLGLLSNAMDAINKKLTQLGFNDNYHIGGAYFKKIKDYYTNRTKMWDNLWEYHLKGTLYEYFRGEPDADKKLNQLKEEYSKSIIKPKETTASNKSRSKKNNVKKQEEVTDVTTESTDKPNQAE